MTATRVDVSPLKEIGDFPITGVATLPAGTDVRINFDDAIDKEILKHEIRRGLAQIMNSDFPRV